MRAGGLFLIFCAAALRLSADTITKTDGAEVEGTVLRVTDQAVEYRTAKVPFLTLPRDQVAKIRYTSGEVADLTIRNPDHEKQVPGFHRHDGFFLRLMGGYNYTSLELSENSPLKNMNFGKAGAHVVFDFGFSVTENLALYLHTGGGGGSIGYRDIFPFHFDFGAGASWYLMPLNGYISAAIVGTQYSVTTRDSSTGVTIERMYTSGTGAGGFFALGKEWWVSANWGLGAALYCYYGKVPDGVASGQLLNSGAISTLEIGILFSATYN